MHYTVNSLKNFESECVHVLIGQTLKLIMASYDCDSLQKEPALQKGRGERARMMVLFHIFESFITALISDTTIPTEIRIMPGQGSVGACVPRARRTTRIATPMRARTIPMTRVQNHHAIPSPPSDVREQNLIYI